MAAQRNVGEITAECDEYWRQTRVPADVIPRLHAELATKLDAGLQQGKSPRQVVGRDVLLFAETMASQYRVPPPTHPPLSPSERARARWVDFVPAYGWIVPIVGAAVLLMMFGPKEDAVDDPDFWRWLWLGIAVVLGIGEMLTAGFFMLPFAIGAAIAALLAWADVSLTVQLVVFITTSLVAVVALRRFAWSDHEPSYPVGVKRFVNARGVVTEPIDPVQGSGRVRIGQGENWRATSANATPISTGSPIRVVEVAGTHLVVEPIDNDS
jgi:membrane protein implicated in regulation of membrane protease activity